MRGLGHKIVINDLTHTHGRVDAVYANSRACACVFASKSATHCVNDPGAKGRDLSVTQRWEEALRNFAKEASLSFHAPILAPCKRV